MGDSIQSAPRLLLIAGAAGVGKTTLAQAVTQKLEFSRYASSDMVREVMRACSTPASSPALHRSSYSRGETGDAVTDWLDSCSAVESGIEAVIGRARREGIDLVLEGAHIIPANRFINEWVSQGGVALGVALCIDHVATHRARIEQREANSWRTAARYLAAFDRICDIQTNIVTRAKGADWKILDTHLHDDGEEKVRQWLNQAWYQQR